MSIMELDFRYLSGIPKSRDRRHRAMQSNRLSLRASFAFRRPRILFGEFLFRAALSGALFHFRDNPCAPLARADQAYVAPRKATSSRARAPPSGPLSVLVA